MSINKMKYAKIKNENGTYTDTIPIGVDAENVDLSDGRNLEQVISNIINFQDIAPVFNKIDRYTVGDYVFYENDLYRFIADHNTGVDWNENYVQQVILTQDIKNIIQIGVGQPVDETNKIWINPAGNSNIQILTYNEFLQFKEDVVAKEFNAAKSYKIGDYIFREGKLYKFKSQHTKNTIWNINEVQLVLIADKLQKALDFQVIAPEFEVQKAYSIGDCVFKDQKFYEFIVNHNANVNWNEDHVKEITFNELLKGWTPIDIIADFFDYTKSYEKQDYVIRENKLYRFVTSHSSNTNWNNNQVENVTITMELRKLLNPWSVAEQFSTDKAYNQKDYVLKDGKLYRFIANHSINTGWRDNQVEEITVADCLKELSKLTAIAPIFNDNNNYKKDDCVFYNGILYQFTKDHNMGNWNQQQVKQTSISQRLKELSNSQVIAPVFDINTYYPIGSYVFKDNLLYRFKVNHSQNTNWNLEEVENIAISQVLEDLSSSDAIAPTFTMNEGYNEGDYVFREGKLYKFTEDHLINIDWKNDDVQQTSIAAELEEIKRIVFNLIQVDDNNHSLIFN